MQRDGEDGPRGSQKQIAALFREGGTALYDAIAAAYGAHLRSQIRIGAISAIVVLTDGEDNDSKISLEDLLQRIKFDNERQTVRVFTIAYGGDAKKDILQRSPTPRRPVLRRQTAEHRRRFSARFRRSSETTMSDYPTNRP